MSYRTLLSKIVIAVSCLMAVPVQIGVAGLFGTLTGEAAEIRFSPDSSKIAFMWFKASRLTMAHAPLPERKIYIYWCDVATPKSQESVLIDTVGKEFSGSISIPTDFTFSPDSRHLLVGTPNYLSVVALKSKRLSQISHLGEKVTSFQWLNAEEIGYVVHTKSKDGGEYDERTFWRQKVKDGRDLRVCIYSESGGETSAEHFWLGDEFRGYHLEHWSPKGRYVVFLSKPYCRDSRFKLLDVAKGEILTSFGRAGSYDEGVCWTLDDSKAFCLGGITGVGQVEQAYLVETPSSKISDCSGELIKSFAKDTPVLRRVWTSDGKYILANDYLQLGSCLIQPSPWKVITINEHLAKHLTLHKEYKPHLFPIAVSNWVGVNAVGVDNKIASDEAAKYAFNYETHELVKLFDTRGWWACSPDGRWGATVQDNRRLAVHKLRFMNSGESTTTP